MRGVSAAAAILRRMRVERGPLALLFVLVAVTTFVLAVSPRLFDRMADDGLRYDILAATAAQRDLQFQVAARIPAQAGDPFARITARGDELYGRVPDALRAVVARPRFDIRTSRVAVAEPPLLPTIVSLGYRDGIEDGIRYVEGRAPQRMPPVVEPGADAPTPAIEIGLASAAMDATGTRVGDRLVATVDPSDPLLARTFPRPTTRIILDVVGRFELIDPAADVWSDETTYADATIGGTEERPIAYVTGVFAPAAYQDVRTLDLPALYRWRLRTDPATVEAADLPTLTQGLRQLDAAYDATGGPGQVLYRSGLLGVIDRFTARRAATGATLSVAALGPVAVAVGALALVALVVVRRRRPTLLLSRSRGASAAQLLGAQAWEGLLVAVPAALVGYAMALAAVPARSTTVSGTAAAGVALAATSLLVAATWPLARRARRDLEREDAPATRPSPRRLVMEATLVGLAVVATWLLRERTVGAEGIGSREPGADPFLAAAPLLIGIAVAIVAIRAYPIPVRALAAVAGRRRDLVPVLGLRSIGRHPSAAYLPLLVLTVTVAIGVFSSVVQATIDRGQLEASWQQVGGDFRVDAAANGVLPPDLDAASLAGSGAVAVARAFNLTVPPTGDGATSRTTTLLRAIDPAAWADVMAGGPLDDGLPSEFRAAPTGAGIGRAEAPIPAIVSTRLPNGWPQRRVGDTVELLVRGQDLVFRVVRISETFPGIPVGSTFVVAPLPSVLAAHDRSALRPNMAFLRGPLSLGPAIEGRLAATLAGERLVSRYATYAALHDAPLVGAVGLGFGMALVVAIAYASLAVIAVISLDAQRRARELAYLRTLGLTDRQLIGLTVVEHAPPVALALAIGVTLGLAVAWLLAPGLRLAVFIDPGAPVVLRVDIVVVALVLVAVAVVVAAAVGASSWLARRLAATDALRIGEV